jgi:ribonuclease VapC
VIVVDSSALLAILLPEADARSYADAIVDSEACSISSFTLFETQVVIHRRGLQEGIAQLSRLLTQSRAITVPFDESQSIQAFDAYRRFGKGIHSAGLNLGDCATYALAKSLDAPLLFKGNDFARTDIRRAL